MASHAIIAQLFVGLQNVLHVNHLAGDFHLETNDIFMVRT